MVVGLEPGSGTDVAWLDKGERGIRDLQSRSWDSPRACWYPAASTRPRCDLLDGHGGAPVPRSPGRSRRRCRPGWETIGARPGSWPGRLKPPLPSRLRGIAFRCSRRMDPRMRVRQRRPARRAAPRRSPIAVIQSRPASSSRISMDDGIVQAVAGRIGRDRRTTGRPRRPAPGVEPDQAPPSVPIQSQPSPST